MNEYLVKFHCTVGYGVFSRRFEGSDVYRASSAHAAIEQAREEYKKKLSEEGIDQEEAPLVIDDIRRV